MTTIPPPAPDTPLPDTLPPDPAAPADLLRYPTTPPDWVDALARTVAQETALALARALGAQAEQAAERATAELLTGVKLDILEQLKRIEDAIAEGVRRSDANWDALRTETRRHADRLAALEAKATLVDDLVVEIRAAQDALRRLQIAVYGEARP